MSVSPNHVPNRNDRALSPSLGLWLSTLAWLGASQLAIGIVSLPSTARLFCPRRDFQVGDVTDTCKRLSSKAVGADGGEVLKSLQLRCREALTQDWQVVLL